MTKNTLISTFWGLDDRQLKYRVGYCIVNKYSCIFMCPGGAKMYIIYIYIYIWHLRLILIFLRDAFADDAKLSDNYAMFIRIRFLSITQQVISQL